MKIRITKNPETGEWSVGISGFHSCGQKIGYFETFTREPTEAQTKAVLAGYERLKALSESEINAGIEKQAAFMKSLCPTCYKTKSPQ